MKIKPILFSLFTLYAALSQAQDSSLPPEENPRLLQLRAMMQQQGRQLTPEQESMFLQQLQRQDAIQGRIIAAGMAAMMGSPVAQGGQMPGSNPPPPALSEEAVLAKLSALPDRPERIAIDNRMDGFSINGAGYVDPEGRIRNYAIDPVSGLATYLAETGPNTFVIKVVRVGTDTEPLLIGTALRRETGWQVETVTGKRMNGENLTVMQGAGVLVARGSAAFIYRPGKGIQNIAVPKDYIVARFQRGDVLGTNHLLLERYVPPQSRDGIFDSLKALGGTLGINKTEDYALYNLAKGAAIPINISDSGKKVGSYSNCHRKNAVVNECANVDFRESLYDNIGKNLSHYYWRINWFSTPSPGGVLIAQENGLKDITIRDLATGKKVTAFSRALGISGYDAVQGSDGKIRVFANMGLSRERIDDAVAFLANNEANEMKAASLENAATDQ